MVPWVEYLEEGISPQLQMYRIVQDYPDHPPGATGAEAGLIGIRNLYRDRTPEYWRQRTLLETAFQEWKTEESERKKKEAEARILEAQALVKSSAPSDGTCAGCGRPIVERVEDLERWKLMELLE